MSPLYIIITLLKVFPTSVSRWFITGVWVTASLSKSSGLFSVFWPISVKLYFEWSPLVLIFPSPLVPVSILWWLCQGYQLYLVSPSLSCSTGFSILLQGPGTYLSFHFLSVLLCDQQGQQSPQFGNFFFFCWLLLGQVVVPRFGDPLVFIIIIIIITSGLIHWHMP